MAYINKFQHAELDPDELVTEDEVKEIVRFYNKSLSYFSNQLDELMRTNGIIKQKVN